MNDTVTAKSNINAHISEETKCRTSKDKSIAEVAHSSDSGLKHNRSTLSEVNLVAKPRELLN